VKTVVATTRREFNFGDQELFARLSGDCNPVHLDPVAARRSLFGGPVVHGVHALLWGLDTWLGGREGDKPLEIRELRVEFRHPLPVGQEVNCAVEEDDDRTRIELRSRSASILTAVVTAAAGGEPAPDVPQGTFPLDSACAVLSADTIGSASGELELRLDREAASRLFPGPARRLPHVQTAVLLASTRLVGTACPGLNSVYSGLALKFSPAGDGSPLMQYRVGRFDSVLSLVQIELEASGTSGSIKAFLRPPPLEQASYGDLASLVEPGEFSSQKALVVGGSRGLGEVAAKLLAAGDAEVRLTYNTGSEDAQRVVDEIGAAGGNARCLAFDVMNVPDDLADRIEKGWLPTDLYYFATPFIFGATPEEFSTELFDRFCGFYVKGFSQTVDAMSELGVDRLRILYPSSAAIDEAPRDMAEYAAAKAAGERLCRSLQQEKRGLIIAMPRFPRLATDQTASVFPVKNLDPAPVLLKALRELREL